MPHAELAYSLSRTLLFALAGFYLSSCADYSYTINDKVVYTPEPLFADYAIPNANLEDCVDQYISDNRITAAAQLEELNCSHAGITELQGLQVFTGLRQLKLSSNAISDLSPLADFEQLTQLYLDNNEVLDVNPLRGLPGLSYLDLRGNKLLRCNSLDSFDELPEITLVRPQHCQS